MDPLRLKTVLIGVDEEAGETTMGLLGVGLGEDQRHLGVIGERDEHLGAVDHPAGVGLAGSRALVGGVGPGVGLGQAKATQPLARAQLRQVVLLLFLGAPAKNRRTHQRCLNRDHGSHRRVAPSDLLDDQPVGDVVEASASVLARHDRAQVPLSAIFLTSSRSKCSLRSFSRARSTISLSVKARAVSRIRRCSSFSSKSMGLGN